MTQENLRRATRPQPIARVTPSRATPSRAAPSRAAPSRQTPAIAAYVASSEERETTSDPLDPAFLQSMDAVRVVVTADPSRMCGADQTLAEARGYARDDLLAVAEIAHAYLFCGFTDLALVLFEGLNAVAPREAYFALALGLNHDLRGDLEASALWYRRASQLDPSDARPDVNRAELAIESKQWREARQLLMSAHAKTRRNDDDPVLHGKVIALFEHLDRLEKKSCRHPSAR